MSQIMDSTPLRTGHGWGQLVSFGKTLRVPRPGLAIVTRPRAEALT